MLAMVATGHTYNEWRCIVKAKRRLMLENSINTVHIKTTAMITNVTENCSRWGFQPQTGLQVPDEGSKENRALQLSSVLSSNDVSLHSTPAKSVRQWASYQTNIHVPISSWVNNSPGPWSGSASQCGRPLGPRKLLSNFHSLTHTLSRTWAHSDPVASWLEFPLHAPNVERQANRRNATLHSGDEEK